MSGRDRSRSRGHRTPSRSPSPRGVLSRKYMLKFWFYPDPRRRPSAPPSPPPSAPTSSTPPAGPPSPQPGCSHWPSSPTSSAPLQGASQGSSSASSAPAPTLSALLSRLSEVENDLDGKRKVLNLIVAGAEFVREDIEQMSRMILEAHRIVTSANFNDPNIQQLARLLLPDSTNSVAGQAQTHQGKLFDIKVLDMMQAVTVTK